MVDLAPLKQNTPLSVFRNLRATLNLKFSRSYSVKKNSEETYTHVQSNVLH